MYDGLKEMAKNKVPGAEPLYEALRTYFRKNRKGEEHDPTIKEAEKIAKKLLHGEADGKIEIVNESPKIKRGSRKIVDVVRKGKTVVKKSAGMEDDE